MASQNNKNNSQKKIQCKLHHVNLKVKDLKKSADFYKKTFGFTKKAEWKVDEDTIILLNIGNDQFLEIWGSPTFRGSENSTIKHLAFVVESCKRVYNKALKNNSRSIMEPTEYNNIPEYPIKVAFVRGPDGEEVEIVEKL